MARNTFPGPLAPSLAALALVLTVSGTTWAQYDQLEPSSPIREIGAPGERLEMIVNTSRILTLSPQLTRANQIPQVQVNNDQILNVIPLSPTQVQVFAKREGVTTVNVWDANGEIYSVDVLVYPDARELTMVLKREFPNASIRVTPIRDSVLISGYVDQPEHATKILDIAARYYKDGEVLTNIDVSCVHQVLLQIKVIEVSRTKLRALGLDWSVIGPDGRLTVTGADIAAGAETVVLDIFSGDDAFFGTLEALREDRLAKILAEPNIVAMSGRASKFHVGGEFTVVPQGLAAAQPKQIEYGTTVDFVPMVLGNGRIRLEVRPNVSEIDESLSVDGIPGLRTRKVDTAVELQAGQTLAIAGLLQNRVESQRRGIPFLSELPYVGVAFGRVQEFNNEVELLILVTPQLIDAMDAEDVPECGPGMRTTSPSDFELYCKGYIEVPRCCPPGAPGMILGEDGQMLAPEQVLSPAPSESSAAPPRPTPAESRSAPRVRPTAAQRAPTSTSPRRQNPSSRQNRPAATTRSGTTSEMPGFVGPIGYDVAE